MANVSRSSDRNESYARTNVHCHHCWTRTTTTTSANYFLSISYQDPYSQTLARMMCGPRGSCSKTLSAWSMQKLGISTCTQKHCSSSLSTRSMFEQRQCKLQSKLRYLLSGRKSVVDMKPLQTLHGKRVRDPLWFLIGNIATCLGNAPHPGMAASANYIEWLECLSSCCFEYEQGLTILCQ